MATVARWLSAMALGGALVAVLFWPAVATVRVAIRGGSEAGAGLLTPAPAELDSGSVRRPLALAGETSSGRSATVSAAAALIAR